MPGAFERCVALCLSGALIGGCSLQGSGSGGLMPLSEPCGPRAVNGQARSGDAANEPGVGASEEGDSADLPLGSAGVAQNSVINDNFATEVAISVHPNVNTLLVVTWSQTVAAEQVWLEFTFESGNVMRSRGSAGSLGEHRDVVLGVPGETDVTVRIVGRKDGVDYRSRDYASRTRTVPTGPNGMPVPTIVSHDPALASSERWLFGSVEASPGGRYEAYYLSTFWLYIMDRQGRVVWYYADPGSSATYSFQRIARDGEYLWFEKRCYACANFAESVVKMTLDRSYFQEIPVPALADAIDVTDAGSLLYDAHDELREMSRDGTFRRLWSCRRQFGLAFDCYSNTVNYNPLWNTVLMSFPYEGTVVEIDRQSGQMVAQYGNAPGSCEFAPPLSMPPKAWQFGFQHFPNITPAGTLLLSSHMPGFDETSSPVANQHAFLEFDIDREGQQLIEKWRYTDGPEWPHAKGMAIRLANGNTLVNYGTGGAIREITPDKRTAFHVKFDTPGGNDFYNRMVGNNVLIDDLYALNGGGPR
ncbi:MAG: hypothetical protein ABI895_00445 [Deltaproteobacteria bacterium]